ncbi:MAG: polymer-forming cytoskeletal protein [Firmicutes bacterium]|nr:polymer-forming cytoskeletal protein [Bacillota bacterium]
MSNKESFVKAFKELTGLDDDKNTGTADESFERLISEREFIGEPAGDMRMRTEPVAPKKTEVYVPDRTRGDGTYVTQGMNIAGVVTSADNIEVLGRIDGDVDVKGDFISEGIIVGDIAANNVLTKKSSVVKGEIKAEGAAVIEKDVTVIGNITAGNIRIDGKVKGNLFVEGNTELTANALVAGDIQTARISVSSGSRIKGSIITKSVETQVDEDEFDIEV